MDYYIYKDENQTGPFTLGQLQAMWASGMLTADILFWHNGAPNWAPLRTISDILELPPVPSPEAGSKQTSSPLSGSTVHLSHQDARARLTKGDKLASSSPPLAHVSGENTETESSLSKSDEMLKQAGAGCAFAGSGCGLVLMLLGCLIVLLFCLFILSILNSH